MKIDVCLAQLYAHGERCKKDAPCTFYLFPELNSVKRAPSYCFYCPFRLPPGAALGGMDRRYARNKWSLAFGGHKFTKTSYRTHIRGTKSPNPQANRDQHPRTHLGPLIPPQRYSSPREPEAPERPRGVVLGFEWAPGLTRILGAPSRGLLVLSAVDTKRLAAGVATRQLVLVSVDELVARA